MNGLGIRAALFAFVALCALLPASAASQQQRGSISGQVVDATTGRPIGTAQVFIPGTSLNALTSAEGTYQIANVPVGRQTVRVTVIGYSQGDTTVQVTAGETTVADFSLNQSAIQLGAVIVTATGEQQSLREVGNAVGSINVAEQVSMATVQSVSDVLAGRVAGVSVLQSGGTAGTGARVRIRGSNSVSLSNDPLLVVDGVRVDNDTDISIGVGGQETNRLDDIPPENIETIEVLKGPAASALYGTAAANGVIVITTKSGRGGDTQYRFYVEQGRVENFVDFPANFNAVDATGSTCLLVDVADNACTIAEVQSFNPLEDRRSTPFETGSNAKYGLSISGGSQQGTTYFLAGDIDRQEGVYKFDLNHVDRVSLRGNLRAQLEENFDVSVKTGYTTSEARLPQNDNNVLGIVSGGLLGLPEFDETSFGYGFGVKPEDISAIETLQEIDRFTSSVVANYRPLTWLSLNATGGIDNVTRHDNETVPPERVAFGDLPEGERSSNRAEITTYTANLNATATYGLMERLYASTSVGAQYNEEEFRQTEAFGAALLAGTRSLNGVNERFEVDEDNTEIRLVGLYAQQQLTWRDRVYLTGAVRADDNSAFGQDFGLVYYPSVSLSWVVAEEEWFPQLDVLSTLRLRSAYGRSGLRPGFRDALRFLTPVAVTLQGGSEPGFTFGGAGNVNLRPEKSSEIEVGFDAGFLRDRLGLEFTYYNKVSEDALISRTLPPSLGASTSRFENLGEVKNSGFELLGNVRLLDRSGFAWDATASFSTNDNDLVDIGTDPTTGEPIPPIIFGLGGDSQRHQEGFPLGGYWAIPYTFGDENGDGLISVNEVELAGDTLEFQGKAFPSREASLSSTLRLFDVVKISGLLDYRGGYKNFNSTEEFRCGFVICEGLNNPDVSLEQQAAAIATAFFNTPAGFMEDASFVKLREISLELMAPESWATRFFNASAASITISGRNLATWTDYSGLDPEINFAGTSSNFSTAEFLTQPPVRSFTVRVDVTF